MGSPTLTQLGRYRILAELGRGAMGVVYAAEDPLLNRRVAIKTIIMTGDSTERADYEARFYQEAKAAGGLNHPNVVTVHDIGREGAVAYMAMELIDGIELREMMKQSRIALPLALDIIAQVADGLAFAHERGVIHRDVKPGNVMIVRGRHVKIMDFGIARMRESDIQTRAGTLLGSPKYMSPEQVSGERTDHRSDIFSLGVMLYELVTSAPPFSGSSVTRLMHNIATVTPRMPSALNVSLPAMLDLIVGKALDKPLDTRYQNAAEFAADLRACAAEISLSPGAPLADMDATIRLDAASAETQRIDIDAARTEANGDAIKTMASATVARTRATDTGVHLILSRRFDSAQAVQRLVERAAANSGSVAQGAQTNGLDTTPNGARAPSAVTRAQVALRQLQRDPERRVLAIAVTVAMLAAAAIAFVGVGE